MTTNSTRRGSGETTFELIVSSQTADEFSEAQLQIVAAGADAFADLHDFSHRSFDCWMLVAGALVVLREIADKVGTKRAFVDVCQRYGFGKLNKSTRSRLLTIAQNEHAVRAWRDTLTANQRERWGSPQSIVNRCPALMRLRGAKEKLARSKAVSRIQAGRAADTLADYLHSDQLAPDERMMIAERVGLSAGGWVDDAETAYRIIANEMRTNEAARPMWRERLRSLVDEFDTAPLALLN
jgi:hypothetical protein